MWLLHHRRLNGKPGFLIKSLNNISQYNLMSDMFWNIVTSANGTIKSTNFHENSGVYVTNGTRNLVQQTILPSATGFKSTVALEVSENISADNAK